MRKWLKIIPILFLPIMVAGQTTYYVDPAGSDANDGKGSTLDRAWRTAYKVSHSSFNPDDQILFKRGNVWKEILQVTSSGTAGHRITYGAYGTGEKPIISAAKYFSGSWATTAYTNVYSISAPTNPVYLELNGVCRRAATQLSYVDGTETSTSDHGTWRWESTSGGTLYVYSPSGTPYQYYGNAPDKIQGMMGAGMGGSLDCINHDYITLNNLHFRGENSSMEFKNSDSVSLTHCYVGLCGAGIVLGQAGGAGSGCNNFVVQYDTCDFGNAIRYHTSPNTILGEDLLGGRDGIMVWGGNGLRIQYSKLGNSSHALINLYPSADMTVNDWVIESNEMFCTNSYNYPITSHSKTTSTGSCSGGSFQYNKIHGFTMRLQLAGDHNNYCYNIVDTVWTSDFWKTSLGGNSTEHGALALASSGDALLCAYNKFSNNTIMRVDGSGIDMGQNANTYNNQIYGNIFYDCGLNRGGESYLTDLVFYQPDNGGSLLPHDNDIRNNFFYQATSGGTSLVIWNAYINGTKHDVAWLNGADANGTNVQDNQYANPSILATYKLNTGSPAINSGYSWSATRDYFGSTITDGQPDAGAHEYGGTASVDTLALVVTSAASSVTTYTAVLNGTVDANSTSSTTRLMWGTSTGVYTDSVTATPSPVTGTVATSISYSLGGLSPSTQYFFRAAANNAAGYTRGSELNFTTSAGDVTRPIKYASVTHGPLRDSSGIGAVVSVSAEAGTMVVAYVIGYHASGFPAVSSITCGGNAMTLIGSQMNPWNVAGVRAYYYKGASAGNNAVSVTMASAPTDLSLIVSSWYNVDQTTPVGEFGSASGVGSQMSLSVSTQTGDVVVDCGVSNYGSLFTGLSSGQTEICRIDGSGYINDAMHSQKPNTSTSTTVTQDRGEQGYAYIAFPIHKNVVVPLVPSTRSQIILQLVRP